MKYRPADRHTGLSRRQSLLLGGGALLASMPLFMTGAAARSEAWQRVDEARELVGDATPESGGIALELPLVSEDGSAVSLTIRVDGPMNETDHVETVHLFAPGNPTPELAVFHFTPLAGRAEIQTRVRLNESQTVIAIARMRSGELRVAEREVRVTTTGCLMRDDTYPESDLMQTRIRVPDSLAAGEPGEVLTIINHPMETGLRTDSSGETLPKRIIKRFEALLDGEPAIIAELHRSISANPYLRFHVAPREDSELTLIWVEDTGERVVETAMLQVS
jgi:sulfur-oxidizing protein SoxY